MTIITSHYKSKCVCKKSSIENQQKNIELNSKFNNNISHIYIEKTSLQAAECLHSNAFMKMTRLRIISVSLSNLSYHVGHGQLANIFCEYYSC